MNVPGWSLDMVTSAAAQTPAVLTPRRRPVAALIAVAVIALVQVLLVLLFAWSSSRAAPHEVPIVVAGPPQAAQGLTQGLARARPGAFAVTVVADDAAARNAVTGRTAYGAVVLGASGSTVYTASAASGTVAQALAEGLPAALKQAVPNAPVTVTDLVPGPAHDPHGAALPSGLIPITITSIVAGAAIGLLASGRGLRLIALGGYAVIAGAFSTYALQTALGALTGPWVADAGTLTLACLAIAAATTGLVAALGPAGAGLGAIVVFFLGFPFSGATTAWEFVPTPWGHLAQYLPVGAANTGLRSVAFFGGAGSIGPLVVLACWALAGVVLGMVVRRPPGVGSA
jgi:hypothetical protein